jgi:hypothetical protein
VTKRSIAVSAVLALALSATISAQQSRSIADIVTDLEKLVAELRDRHQTILVNAGDSVQAAINAARPGDAILLLPGVKYVGPLTLPAQAGVVTIKSAAQLPDRRIGPADAALLPILASWNLGPAITGTGAANWTLDGIAVESRADGLGDVIVLQDAQHVTFDRLLLVAGANGQKRAIRGNGQDITLTRSYIANIWRTGQDSQAFCAWDGAGPYTITDNYLEAASENVMFGGADSQSAERIPADITITGNTFTKNPAWKAVKGTYVVKNLLELKAARRVTIRDNVFDGSWTDAQTGYALSIKSVNQGYNAKAVPPTLGAPWSVTEDVLVENNTILNSESGFNLLGVSADQPGGRTTRVTIRGNLIDVTNIAIQAGGELGIVTVDRNTWHNGGTFLQLYGATYGVQQLTVTNNLANHNAYGVKGDGTGIGLPSLTRYASGFAWAQNVLLGGAGKGSYPPETWYDLASVPAGVTVGR